MTIHYILRRRALGKTSAREIALNSQEGLQVYRNDGMKYDPESNRYIAADLPETDGYVIRWGCTSSIPGNPKIINKASGIHQVNNKAFFRSRLSDNGLAPKTWLSTNEIEAWNFDYFDGGCKVVVRPTRHAQGRHLHVCGWADELFEICNRYGEGNYYISELIDKVAEYRVCVAFGRVAWVAKKIVDDPSQVAWNVAQGGRFENVNWSYWPLKAIEASLKAFFLSDLDFGGVDVMVDAHGNCFVLEINSAMSLTSPYRQRCMARVFDYMIRNGRDHIPINEESETNWRKFIHPAISAIWDI